MEHVPVWVQAIVAIALFLGAMIGSIIVVSKRGAKYLSDDGAGDAGQFIRDLRSLRQDVDAKLVDINAKLQQLTVDIAVMRERQTNNLQLLQDLQKQFVSFERRRRVPSPEDDQ